MSADGCRHLRGTWERRGAFSVLRCERGDYAVVVEVDSPEAYALFEGGSGGVQLFGPALKPATPDDAERLEDMKLRGLEWP